MHRFFTGGPIHGFGSVGLNILPRKPCLYYISLYTNEFFLLVCYNKLGIVHCAYLGVSGYNFQKILYSFCLKIFTFTNSVDPDKKAASYGISFGSSLYVKVLI